MQLNRMFLEILVLKHSVSEELLTDRLFASKLSKVLTRFCGILWL